MAEKPNMAVSLKGRRMRIEFDIDKEGHISGTGKSTIVFSSGGFQWPANLGYGVSVNVIKSKRAQ
jgi:hypothetical protein